MPAFLLLSLLAPAAPSLDIASWNSTTGRPPLYTPGGAGSTPLDGKKRLPCVSGGHDYLKLGPPPRGLKAHAASVAQRMVEVARAQDAKLWMATPVRDAFARTRPATPQGLLK